VQKEVVERAKEAHVGKKLGREVRSIVKESIKAGLASGSGAYGRGAYGRGSYGLDGSQVAVNSLFNEYAHRRHETNTLGDETGRVNVSRREYVMRVVAPASTSFENTSFAINPGLSGVFAWLSQIAANYDEYTLNHLIFHYKPVISQASQTGTMGSILLSCNYNAGAPKFATFREMAEYVGTLETRICDEALFGVECDYTKHSSAPVEYIRTGSVPVGQDIKTYDLGTFQLATSDVDAVSFPAGTLLGHLYVEYDVTLGKPKLYSALGKNVRMDMFRAVTGVTTALPFGDFVLNPSNSLGCVLTGQFCSFPDNFYGTVLVTYYVDVAATGSVSGVTIATSGNVSKVAVLGPTGGEGHEYSLWNGLQYIQKVLLDVSPATSGLNNHFQIANTLAAGTSPTGMSLMVSQVNPDFISW